MEPARGLTPTNAPPPKKFRLATEPTDLLISIDEPIHGSLRK